MRVGTWLLNEKKSIKVNDLALLLGVSRRTLLNWKRQVHKPERKIGRPSYTEAQRFRAVLNVGRSWKNKAAGDGWRPVRSDLNGIVQTRLTQKTLAKLKLLHRRKLRDRIASHRQSVRVKNKNVFWVQDGAKYAGQQHQVIKDRASLKVLSIKINKNETGKAVVEQLIKIKSERKLPLVLGTDNGSMYANKEVQEFLDANKIIHLRSLPRTPQHNGAIECAIRELKEAASLNGSCLSKAAEKINQNRLRARFLFKSSSKMDDTMVEGYDEQVRQDFFNKCKARLKAAEAFTENKRSRRMEERRIIFETLEQFGFIEISRGRLV